MVVVLVEVTLDVLMLVTVRVLSSPLPAKDCSAIRAASISPAPTRDNAMSRSRIFINLVEEVRGQIYGFALCSFCELYSRNYE